MQVTELLFLSPCTVGVVLVLERCNLTLLKSIKAGGNYSFQQGEESIGDGGGSLGSLDGDQDTV